MKKTVRKIIVAGGAWILVAATVLSPAVKTFAHGSNKIGKTKTLEGVVITDVSDVVKNVMPSIVSVTAEFSGQAGFGKNSGLFEGLSGMDDFFKEESSSSGIIVSADEENLYILTNKHVVSGADEIYAGFPISEDEDDTEMVKASLNGTDTKHDLAVISVKTDDIGEDTAEKLKVATLGTAKDLEVGDPAIAIGNALGYGMTVTTGIISAFEKTDGEINEIQTDAAINFGSSGGALLNEKGEVIGITYAKTIADYAENMGYAISVDTVNSVLEKLIKGNGDAEEDRGYFGISITSVPKDVSELYGVPQGAYIAEVMEGSASEKAGIKKGDIVTELDGVEISNMDDFLELSEYYTAGETVSVVLKRANDGTYENITLEVTLQAEKDLDTDEKEKAKSIWDKKDDDTTEENRPMENAGKEKRDNEKPEI